MTLPAESVTKRTTLADKYRVEKRVKAHKKKAKKLAKKVAWRCREAVSRWD